jgi:arylsulfatase A-like enzyme
VHLADAGGPFGATRENLRAVGLTTRPYPADHHDAAVLRLDRELGRLLEALPPEAWVVVAGSRGVSLGETRAGWTEREQARFGHHMFEELVRVPLMVRAPGVEPRRVAAMVSLVDVAPTLLRAVDHPPSPRLDGAPLAEPFGETRIDRAVTAHSSLYGPEQQMVIVAGHKLVRTADGRNPVYDLVGDPAETTPLREAGTENDSRQRRLGALLPQSGSLVSQPPLVWQVGQFMSRFVEEP